MDLDERFYMVANAEGDADFYDRERLLHPPRVIHRTEKDAEREAVRLATATGQRFFVVEAKAYVEIVDGTPKWTEV